MNRHRSLDLTRNRSAQEASLHAKRSSVALNAPFTSAITTELLDIQEKTFRKWLNAKLASAELEPMTNLGTDLSDGVKLIQLIEIMSGNPLGKYNKRPVMRVQKAENITLALGFVRVGAIAWDHMHHQGQLVKRFFRTLGQDIIDCNLKLILGLIWTLILRFTMTEIEQGGKSAKDGLLLWCQRSTADYHPQVDIKDFSRSWRDGLAFCALVHKHRPDLIDYQACTTKDPFSRVKHAFQVAEEHLGIPQILDVADVTTMSIDERSTMTYVAELFHAFSQNQKAQSAVRRIVNFAGVAQSAWEAKHDYEARASALLSAIEDIIRAWEHQDLPTEYSEAARVRHQFLFIYKEGQRRAWSAERLELEALLANLISKLKTYGLKPYTPPVALSLHAVEDAWKRLAVAENERHRSLIQNIQSIQNRLQTRFAELANAFIEDLRKAAASLASLSGSLEVQEEHAAHLLERLTRLIAYFPSIKEAEDACDEANVEYNDQCVYSCDDLKHEAQLVKDAVAKRIAFLQNQRAARKQTNLTPAQLEEFESVFRHFDVDHSNTLEIEEFAGALSGLGFNYSQSEAEDLHARLADDEGRVTFESYLSFLVKMTEDSTSPEQIREAFSSLSSGRPWITRRNLELARVPAGTTDFLERAVPRGAGGAHERLDYGGWIQSLYE